MKILKKIIRQISVGLLSLSSFFIISTATSLAASNDPNYNPNPNVTTTEVGTTFIASQEKPMIGKPIDKGPSEPSIPNTKYYNPISGSLPQTGLLSQDMLRLFGMVMLISTVIISGSLLKKNNKQIRKENTL